MYMVKHHRKDQSLHRLVIQNTDSRILSQFRWKERRLLPSWELEMLFELLRVNCDEVFIIVNTKIMSAPIDWKFSLEKSASGGVS